MSPPKCSTATSTRSRSGSRAGGWPVSPCAMVSRRPICSRSCLLSGCRRCRPTFRRRRAERPPRSPRALGAPRRSWRPARRRPPRSRRLRCSAWESPRRRLAGRIQARAAGCRRGADVRGDVRARARLARDPRGRADMASRQTPRRDAGNLHRRADVCDAACASRRALARADRRPPLWAGRARRCPWCSARWSPRRC